MRERGIDMEESIITRLLDLLDIQQAHCMDMGASVSANCLAYPKGGNKRQNSYYMGHLNMAQGLAWELHKDIVKVNGKHVLVDERSV